MSPRLEPAHRRLLGLLGLAIFFEGYGRSIITLTLPYVGRDLATSGPQLSYALAAISAGALGVLPLGKLIDRLGRRRLLLGCVLLYSLLGAGTATATALPALVAWQAGARMFQEGALLAAVVIAVEEMPAARRGIAQGVLGTANSIGSGLGAFLLGFIGLFPGGWRGLCLVSLLPLLLLPLLGRSIPETRRWAGRTEPHSGLLPRAYRGRLLAGLAVIFLAMSYDVAGFAFTTWVPKTRHGWSDAQTSALIIVAGGLGLSGFWVGGRLTDRTGRRPSAVVFFVGLALAEAAFFLGGPRALWPSFAAMVFCQAGKTTVLRSWAPELFPTSVRGTASSWLAAGATLGAMTGLAAAGALGAVFGALGLGITLVAIAGLAAAVLAYACLPETGGLELEAASPEAP